MTIISAFMQGATKSQVLLDATQHSNPPHMTWEMLLVALSRCRRPEDFLIFGNGFERFGKLKANIITVAWLAGFVDDRGPGTSHSQWNAQAAVAKLRELRLSQSVHKK
jgi:hypothetical protein